MLSFSGSVLDLRKVKEVRKSLRQKLTRSKGQSLTGASGSKEVKEKPFDDLEPQISAYDDDEMESRYLRFLDESGFVSKLSEQDYQTSEYSSDDYEYNEEEIDELRKKLDSLIEEDPEEANVTEERIDKQAPKKKVKQKEYRIVPQSVAQPGVLQNSSFKKNYHSCQVCQHCTTAFFLKQHYEKKHPASEIGKQFAIDYEKFKKDASFCTVCERTFQSKQNFESHSKVHDPSKPFECEVCFFRYSSQKKLNSHTKSKHSHQEPQPELPKKSPICEFCGKSFCSSSALKKHLKRSCKKLLTCSKCGFKYSENLNIQCRCTTHKISQLKNIEKRKVKEESFEQITTQSSIDYNSQIESILVENTMNIHNTSPDFKAWRSNVLMEVHDNHACPICWRIFKDQVQQIDHLKLHFKSQKDLKRYSMYFNPTVRIVKADTLIPRLAKKRNPIKKSNARNLSVKV